MAKQQYTEYSKKAFRSRAEAEEWAKKQKETLKQGGLGVSKINVNYKESAEGVWTAVILLPI